MPSKAKIQQEIEQTEPKTILTKPFTIMKYMDTRNGIFKKNVQMHHDLNKTKGKTTVLWYIYTTVFVV